MLRNSILRSKKLKGNDVVARGQGWGRRPFYLENMGVLQIDEKSAYPYPYLKNLSWLLHNFNIFMYFENPHKQIWSKFGCRGLLKYHFGAICKNEQNFWRIVQNTGPRPNPNPNQCLDFCKITLYLCILRTPINKFAEIIEVLILSNSILELLAFSQCPPNTSS